MSTAEGQLRLSTVDMSRGGQWIYWANNVEDGVARKDGNKKTTEEFMDVVKENMRRVCGTEVDARN